MSSSGAVLGVALAELVGGFIVALVCGLLIWGDLRLTLRSGSAIPIVRPDVVFFGIIPLCFGILSIATAAGLVFRRWWARISTIILSTVPTFSCALLLLFHPVFLFGTKKGGEYAPLTIGPGIAFNVLTPLLAVLAPISFWWVLMMTSPRLYSEFRMPTDPVNTRGDVISSRPGWTWTLLGIEAVLALSGLVVGLWNW